MIWRPINQVSELIYRHVESTCYEFEVLITKISVWPTTGVRPSDIVSQPGRQGLGLRGSGSNSGLVQQKPGEIRLQVKKKKKHSSGQHWMPVFHIQRDIIYDVIVPVTSAEVALPPSIDESQCWLSVKERESSTGS